MKVRVYLRRHAEWQVPWVQAFVAGLEKHGITAEVCVGYPREPGQGACDLAVFWSHRWQHVIDAQVRHARPYLVLEHGYVGDRVKDWASAGFNGLNGRADFCNANAPGDRWQQYHASRMAEWRAHDVRRYALVMGQVRGDQAVQYCELENWYAASANAARLLGLEVAFRAHPKDPTTVPPGGVQVLTGTLAEALAGAAVAITWNSNSGVDAALAGVPVVAMDQGSMAWPVAMHSMTALDAALEVERKGRGLAPVLLQPDRTQWAHSLAYAQWTEAEFAAGTAWQHLKQFPALAV